MFKKDTDQVEQSLHARQWEFVSRETPSMKSMKLQLDC